MHTQRLSSGFTLIELIVVLVILGILGAIAVPRFIDQTSKARIAALQGLRGAVLSAVALAQAEYRAEGNSRTSTVTTITMDGTQVTVVKNTGAPVASATGGIDQALATMDGFSVSFAAGPPGVATFSLSPNVPNCNFTYTDGASAGTPTNPSIGSMVTSGC